MSAASGATPWSGYSREALTARIVDLGERGYRAKQLFRAMHVEGELDLTQISTLPKALRDRLIEITPQPATALVESQEASDGTTKLLFALHDGRRVEAVLIPEKGRLTVCVSSQVGCPLRCVFCASGVRGLLRNLSTAEIVEPLIHAQRIAGRRPSHIVMMGMGEPLLNLDAVAQAIGIWTDPEGMGFSPRRITVSTALTGAKIEQLAERELGVNLAVSLHAPDDITRTALVPGSPPGRVEELVRAAARFAARTQRDATLEYVLIAGANDTPEHGDALARLARGTRLHVNLIPLNPVAHRPDLAAPSGIHAHAFARRLERHGVRVTLRTKRGDDIAAACGQLALERALGDADAPARMQDGPGPDAGAPPPDGARA